jgi:hypothetical protein
MCLLSELSVNVHHLVYRSGYLKGDPTEIKGYIFLTCSEYFILEFFYCTEQLNYTEH